LKTHKPTFPRTAAALLFCGAASGIFAQGPAPAKAPPIRDSDVVAHLNTAVSWYRQVKASDAWALQPTDDFFKSNQDDLTGQAMTNAFAYGQAMVAVVAAGQGQKPGDAKAARLASRAAANAQELADLRDQESALDLRISAAPEADRPAMAAQRELLQARIDLDGALGDTLGKTLALVAGGGGGGGGESLAEQVSALERTVPGVSSSQGKAPQAGAAPVSRAPSSGLAGRASALISSVRYRRSLEALINETGHLLDSATQLTAPLVSSLRDAVEQGEEEGKLTVGTADAGQLDASRQKIEALTQRVKTLSAALVPLRAEMVAVERSRSNLTEWRASLEAQTDSILRVLLIRAISLCVVLLIVVAVSEVWKRATFKYVRDVRHRRQLLLVRRFASSILIVFVIVLGFVSDFSSLATFAGFITAGIAVALQTIILSVAAYFFLIGRFGVKVGDRVTVSGVTGDVIDIGLVRVFLMELAGTGVDLYPTGRVIVLANSALFSTSPLYKQLPGTDYVWHEVFVLVPGDSDPAMPKEWMLKAVEAVYGGYRSLIEKQHGALERLLDYKTEVPVPSAHVRLGDTGIEVVVRYPAEISRMAEIDENVGIGVLAAIHGNEAFRKSTLSMPRVRTAVKG
jgi:small-conductance mechanosensitive channel